MKRSIVLSLALALASTLGFSQEAPEEYTIGPGDVLHIAVLGQPEMTGDFTVEADGNLRFPFVGRIVAADKSAVELERAIEALLADGYLKIPRVAASVKEYHSRRVFVTGEAARPGAYGLRPERSLLALLRDIGELTPNAGHEVIIIRPPQASWKGTAADDGGSRAARAEGAEPVTIKPTPGAIEGAPLSSLPGDTLGAQVFRLSLREVRSGDPAQDFALSAGDTVYFPRAAQYYVTGQVARAGVFRFEEGITVYQAISLAGGITDRGSSKARIIRIVGGKRKQIPAKPADLVQPEDTVFVPERFF